MEAQQVLRMKEGEGPTSYAKNSSSQRSSIFVTKPFIEDAINEIILTTKHQERINIADLGCSTGPNSLVPTEIIIDVAHEICQRLGCSFPEIQFFLNDLPQNDFNSIFKTIPSLYKKVSEEKGEGFRHFFIYAAPGSFYGRLFPKQSMHFVYSANSLHWRSQVPQFLTDDVGRINKGNIMLGKTSPHIIYEAYLAWFKRDMTDFLKSRAEEIIVGGHMVLHLLGRKILDPFAEEGYYIWDDLSHALRDLVDEGVVEEEKLNNFNMPLYEPHKEELEEVIKSEGSFKIIKFETGAWWSKLNVDPKSINPESQADIARAAMEPILAGHFGQEIMDSLFDKFKLHLKQSGVRDKVFHVVLLN